jgi:hypothetical protein
MLFIIIINKTPKCYIFRIIGLSLIRNSKRSELLFWLPDFVYIFNVRIGNAAEMDIAF